jgi:hypothetical protein
MLLPATEHWLPELLVEAILKAPDNGLDKEGEMYFSHLQLKRACSKDELKEAKNVVRSGGEGITEKFASQSFANEIDESRWKLLAMYQLQLAGKLKKAVYTPRTSEIALFRFELCLP